MPRLPSPLLLLSLVACAPATEVTPCPGVALAILPLQGTRTAASCPGASGQEETAPADGDHSCQAAGLTVDCQLTRPVPACCFDTLFPRTLALEATVAYDVQAPAAALCPLRPHALAYTGTQVPAAGGDLLSVSVDTSSAFLGSCAAACAVTVHHVVTGLVARDAATGAVTGFTGESVETASAIPGAVCAPCAAPCTATWALTAAVAPR